MRLRTNTSAVATALLTAVSLVSMNSAFAHSLHTPIFGHHHIITPPAPPQSNPTDNVKDFGAKGDGTTDDTAAIQNAAADAKTKHKTVLFPAGHYFHKGVLTFDSVPVTGVGQASVLVANT